MSHPVEPDDEIERVNKLVQIVRLQHEVVCQLHQRTQIQEQEIKRLDAALDRLHQDMGHLRADLDARD